MDLRAYNIPLNIDEILREHNKKKLIWYQPFVFSNTAIVGTGAAWNNRIGIRQYICTDSDPQEVQQVFLQENLKLGYWYERLVKMTLECSPLSQHFLDLGCNAGHFSFQVVAAGKQATGIDVWKDCYEFISSLTGVKFDYRNERYSSLTHEVESLRGNKYDFVFASAIQTHLTDPHYFMGYTNRMSRHGMLYTTPVIAGEEPFLRLRITSGRANREVPERFEFLPTVAAMELILKAMRNHVYRRLSQPTDPGNTHRWGVWIALDHEPPAEVLKKHHLVEVTDRVNQFSDVTQGQLSIPKFKLGEK
jgi:SAM-dependent methyltransferase